MYKNTWLSGILLISLLFFSAALFAEPAQLQALSLATASHSTRLLFDLSALTRPQVDQVGTRLMIRLDDTKLSAGLKQPPAKHPLIRSIRAEAAREGLMLVVDLKAAVSQKTFWSKRKEGPRLVVELTAIKSSPPGGLKGAPGEGQAVASQKKGAGKKDTGTRAVRSASVAPKEWVIAIDAGHGGKDTGAIGPNGTQEKDVVFAIARKLEAMIRAEPGMKPVMVRKRDEFIELRQRMEIARKARADLFISLHADAYVNGDARGSSVFTLSPHGATSEAARWLADRENAADLIGGVKLRDKDKLLASVLLDLSQTATLEDSERAASQILNELQKNHHLHHHEVQKAGFAVLKSPDIPSLLIETAFISNPDEERNLCSHRQQETVARSIFYGIRSYFARGRHKDAEALMTAGGKPVVVAGQP